MPYCPKCDMEFVDGITHCSDCGGPLISLSEFEAQKGAEREKKSAAMEAAFGANPDLSLSDGEDDINPLLSGEDDDKSQASQRRSFGRTFVSRRQRYEDMRSSISAFLLVGGIALAFSAVLWAGVVKLPMESGSSLLFKCALSLLGAGCLVIAAVTNRSCGTLKEEADIEDKRTRELIDWFSSTYSAAELDRLLLGEDPSLEGNELEFKRFDLIQDRLITGHDLPNPDYVDYLCDEIYSQVFEKRNES